MRENGPVEAAGGSTCHRASPVEGLTGGLGTSDSTDDGSMTLREQMPEWPSLHLGPRVAGGS